MPSLPSGRHVCLDFDKIQRLVNVMYEAPTRHEINLIDSIDTMYDLYPLIQVHEMIHVPDHSPVLALRLMQGSLPLDTQLAYKDAGRPLTELQDMMKYWSRDDQAAMMTFLLAERTQVALKQQIAMVHAVKAERELNAQPVAQKVDSLHA